VKQTAVEWLVDEIEKHYITNIGTLDPTIVMGLRRQAKEMEKEQIIDAHNNGYGSGYMDEGISPEEFYNETYGGEK